VTRQMHVGLGNFLYMGNFGQETVRRAGTLASIVICNVEFDRSIDCRDSTYVIRFTLCSLWDFVTMCS